MLLEADSDPVRRLAAILPRPLRFLGVGGLGLITDLAIFTVAMGHGLPPLLARLVSLALATFVTWRLNRALTFDRSGRRPADEAMRYATVAAAAQAVSYAVFAILVVTLLAAVPQLAVIVGAAAGALVSYLGQASFAFRRVNSAP
jgi:putative flippase GtrA